MLAVLQIDMEPSCESDGRKQGVESPHPPKHRGLIVESDSKQILKIAPPILSRVFNELGNGASVVGWFPKEEGPKGMFWESTSRPPCKGDCLYGRPIPGICFDICCYMFRFTK